MHPPVLDENDVLTDRTNRNSFKNLNTDPARQSKVEKMPITGSFRICIAIYTPMNQQSRSIDTASLKGPRRRSIDPCLLSHHLPQSGVFAQLRRCYIQELTLCMVQMVRVEETARDWLVLIGFRVENDLVIEAETFADFLLVGPSTTENDQEWSVGLKTVADALLEVETLAIGLVDAPQDTVFLAGLESSHVAARFSGLAATNVKFVPDRTHAELSANTRFLTSVVVILIEDDASKFLWF